MKTRHTPWSRLIAAARQAPADTRDTAAPAGFATRVSALAFASVEPTFSALFARVSMRALGVCSLIMVLGVTLNFSSVLKSFKGDSTAITLNDPVAEWLDAAS